MLLQLLRRARGQSRRAPLSVAGGRSIVDQEPLNTLSFTALLPARSTTTTGASEATYDSSTSGSLSKTFADNTGAIVGVAIAATVALILGVLLMLFLCRRFKGMRKRKFLGTWISPPLMQRDEGVADTYSPVARRTRRGSSAFLRPLSFQSSETPVAANADMPTDDLDYHDDLDSWAAAFPSPPSFPAV
ncbi:hypothetical protein C8F04DRAFT_717313 [Mycena alexandri]|uniref:Uncharacterized protein n=1 Tax=Mycena alexandri TaxID=1745969 RepID=A0AAD6SQC1_9AGAR|nr:hypothetical protein C8F04DRAFT_717313 [Mycena alexandri]